MCGAKCVLLAGWEMGPGELQDPERGELKVAIKSPQPHFSRVLRALL